MTRASTGMGYAMYTTGMRYAMYTTTATRTATMSTTTFATALFRSGVRCGRKDGSKNCDYNTNTEIPFRHDNPIHLSNPHNVLNAEMFPDLAPARRVDDRRVISGILHVLKVGCRWCDRPSR